jgi:hypothetical protein
MYEGRCSAITKVTCYYWACTLALWQSVSFYQTIGGWFWNFPHIFQAQLLNSHYIYIYIYTHICIKIQHSCLKINADEGTFDSSSKLATAETQKLHITFSFITAAVRCNRIQQLDINTLVNMQRDIQKSEHHPKSSAKNMQSNGQPFKSQTFHTVHWALNSGAKGLQLTFHIQSDKWLITQSCKSWWGSQVPSLKQAQGVKLQHTKFILMLTTCCLTWWQ